MAKKTVEELKDSILSYGFNDRTYSTLITHWIDEAQRNMFRKAKLRIELEEYTFETEVDVKNYKFSSTLTNLISVRNINKNPDLNLKQIYDIKEFDELPEEKGSPQAFSVQGSDFWLYPTPSVSGEKIVVRFSKIPSEIAEEASSSPTVAEDYFYLIEVYCLYKAFQKEGDLEMANHYKAIYDTELIDFVGTMNTDTIESTQQVEGNWVF